MPTNNKHYPIVSRRTGAEAGISLLKRRCWFADGEQPTQGGASSAAGSSAGTGNTEQTGDAKTIPYERFKEVNEERRKAEAELEKYRDAERKRTEAEAIAKGDFEKVIGELRPKAERADALEKSLKEYLATELADVPEAMRDLIPQGDVTAQLAWIKQAKTRGLFNAQSAPNTDAGARGDSKQLPKLTAEESQMARNMGLTPEQYAKRKAEIHAAKE